MGDRSRADKFMSLNIRLGPKIAKGTFSLIRLGTDTESNEKVAIKIEDRRSRHRPQLVLESEVYRILQGGVGIPNMKRFGVVGHYNVLAMSLHGPCLEELLTFCDGRFTLKTVLMLADQMIDRIEFIHSKSFVHRDIKPENFLVGAWEDRNQVYLIDFGLAKKYRDSTDSHIPHRENTRLVGTLRYSSMNHLAFGIAQSRRDDLESLGYVLMYFLNGRLPWQGLRAESKEAKREKIKSVKSSMSIEALCADHPREFVLYFEHCRSLQFSDQPNYAYLKRIFRELFIGEGFEYDNLFDWSHQEARVYQQSPGFSLKT